MAKPTPTGDGKEQSAAKEQPVEHEGKDAYNPALLAEAMQQLVAQASEIEAKSMRGAQVRELRDGDSKVREVLLDTDGDPRTQEILRKVLPFLDKNSRGPIFAAVVRNKLFVGTFPVHQQLIDVEQLAGVVVGTLPTVAQMKWTMIGELLKCVKGWVPAQSPEAEMLRAALHDPERWPKLHQDVEQDWLNTRDPFIYECEIKPLFDAYTEWKARVSPTKDDFDFYYSLIR